jgi:hypothetical protein
LQTREFDVEAGSQRLDGQSLGQSGHAFEQDVAVGEQPDGQALDQIVLTDDDFPDFTEKGADKRAGPLHFLVYGTDSCIHMY